MDALTQAMLMQGGGGAGGIPLMSMLGAQSGPPPVPQPGSSLPSYAAGSGGMTVPNAVDIQRANASLPWYRAPGIFQQPPPPAAPAAAAAAPAINSPADALNAANQWGQKMDQQVYGKAADVLPGDFPRFSDPRLIQDHLAQQAMAGDQNAAMALQQLLRGGRGGWGWGAGGGGGATDAGSVDTGGMGPGDVNGGMGGMY